VKVDRQEVHDKKQFETAPDEPLPHIVETAPALLHNRIAAKLPSARSWPPRQPR
jgi:hypothetical protein